MIDYNKLDYCPGCNLNYADKSNQSKANHRKMCKKFFVLLGKDTKELDDRLKKSMQSRDASGACNFLRKNRIKDEQGKDVLIIKGNRSKVLNGVHNFSSINRIHDEFGRDIMALKIRDTKKENGTCNLLRENRDPDWKPSFYRRYHYWYNGIHMRSSYEIKFAKQLDSMNIPWQYEARYFNYEFAGNVSKYFVDFFIPSFGYVEIKAEFFLRKEWDVIKVKLDAVKDCGHSIVLITEKNWDFMIELLEMRFQSRRSLSA